MPTHGFVHCARAIRIRCLVHHLDSCPRVGIRSKDSVPMAVKVIEPATDVDLELTADIDLVLPESRVRAIGRVCITNYIERRNRRVGFLESDHADGSEFEEATIVGYTSFGVE